MSSLGPAQNAANCVNVPGQSCGPRVRGASQRVSGLSPTAAHRSRVTLTLLPRGAGTTFASTFVARLDGSGDGEKLRIRVRCTKWLLEQTLLSAPYVFSPLLGVVLRLPESFVRGDSGQFVPQHRLLWRPRELFESNVSCALER